MLYLGVVWLYFMTMLCILFSGTEFTDKLIDFNIFSCVVISIGMFVYLIFNRK